MSAQGSTARPNGKTPAGLVLRPAVPEDVPAIIDLLCQALGWKPDERHRALFAWKHQNNPFGPSPSWVAADEAGVVGVRMFMRWRFRFGTRDLSAVRAVDTATHSRARGLGVFRALTLRGVDELKSEGVDWVFNTPNDQSLPGYLTMGWRRVGRLPLLLRPASVGVVPRLAAARVPADLWSLPTSAGEDPASVLTESGELDELMASQPPSSGVQTLRTADYVRWRYALGPVAYRAFLPTSSLRDGAAFFRLRQRGSTTEVTIGDVLVPGGDRRSAGRLGRLALEAAGGDYAIVLGSARSRGWFRVPRMGPVLTWRALADTDGPELGQWKLSAGDIELF